MKSEKHLFVALSVLSLTAWACCGTNCTPQLPTLTAAPGGAEPTVEAPQPAITPTVEAPTLEAPQPAITQAVTVEAPTPGASERQNNGPLLMLITDGYFTNGDLWAWDAPDQPLRQLTDYGYNYNPVISPDGGYVAYDSIPREDAPWECSGWPPANIWVLDITSGDAFRAAEQPPDSGSDSCGGASSMQRPPAAWSPDSKSLAWGEHQEPEATDHVSYRLVRYSLEQKTQQVIVPDLPGDQGITSGQQVDWSGSGIVDFTWPDNLLVVYDADGKELFHKQFDANFNACPVGPAMFARWVTDGSSSLIYLQDCSDPFPQYLIDPATGIQSQTSGRLELYSLTAPGGFSLFMTQDSNGNVLWHIAAPGRPVNDLDVRAISVNENPSALDMVAISPDGLQVAYLSNSGLMLYDGSGPAVTIDVALKAGQEIAWIGWGSTGWRIGHP